MALPGVSRSVTAAIYTRVHGVTCRQQSRVRMWTIVGLCFLLVGQDVNKGHREDPLPLGLSFDVSDLQGGETGVRPPRGAHARLDWAPRPGAGRALTLPRCQLRTTGGRNTRYNRSGTCTRMSRRTHGGPVRQPRPGSSSCPPRSTPTPDGGEEPICALTQAADPRVHPPPGGAAAVLAP